MTGNRDADAPYLIGISCLLKKSGERFHKEIGINRGIFVVRYRLFLQKDTGIVRQNKGKEFFRYFGADIIRVGGGDGKQDFFASDLILQIDLLTDFPDQIIGEHLGSEQADGGGGDPGIPCDVNAGNRMFCIYFMKNRGIKKLLLFGCFHNIWFSPCKDAFNKIITRKMKLVIQKYRKIHELIIF